MTITIMTTVTTICFLYLWFLTLSQLPQSKYPDINIHIHINIGLKSQKFLFLYSILFFTPFIFFLNLLTTFHFLLSSRSFWCKYAVSSHWAIRSFVPKIKKKPPSHMQSMKTQQHSTVHARTVNRLFLGLIMPFSFFVHSCLSLVLVLFFHAETNICLKFQPILVCTHAYAHAHAALFFCFCFCFWFHSSVSLLTPPCFVAHRCQLSV